MSRSGAVTGPEACRMESMVRFLELAWDALRSTALRLADWFAETAAAGHLDPRGWPQSVWLIAALAVLVVAAAVLVRRVRRRASKALPEMMISHGEIATIDEAWDEGVAYGPAAPPRASHRLSLTLSNLNPWPVQLLELAVRTRGLRQPVVAEAGSVVPPNGAVDVVAELFDLPGDVGVVELFLYSNRGAKRTYRLSAPLEWEPWDKRYRIRSLSARVAPVARLASQERRRLEKRSYRSAKRRERQKELVDSTWRRAEQLTSQFKRRRSAAAERRVAAFAADNPAGEPLVPSGRPNGARRAAVDPFGPSTRPVEGHDLGDAPHRDPVEEPKLPPRRERLDFPDEF